MRLTLHPKVYSDIDKIMEHYEEVASSELCAPFIFRKPCATLSRCFV